MDAVKSGIRQVIRGTLMDVPLCLALAVVRQPVHLRRLCNSHVTGHVTRSRQFGTTLHRETIQTPVVTNLVYEDLKLDVLVDLVSPGDRLVQLDESLVVVVLCVYHKDERPTPAKDVLRVKGRVKEVNLPREVPDLREEEGGDYVTAKKKVR